MEKINIIRKVNGITEEKVNVLIESALEFYGPKYEQVVLETVKDTLFYELKEEELVNNALTDITGEYFKRTETKACYYNMKDPLTKKTKAFVIWKPKKKDADYHILAHELFGHAVCSKKNPIVKKKHIYLRNGISLLDQETGKERYELLNEGFMETIASSIIRLNKKRIKDIMSVSYALAKRCSDYLFEELGKERMLDLLVLYQENIEDIYHQDKFEKLNRLIERELKMKEIFPYGSEKFEKRAVSELQKLKQRVR